VCVCPALDDRSTLRVLLFVRCQMGPRLSRGAPGGGEWLQGRMAPRANEHLVSRSERPASRPAHHRDVMSLTLLTTRTALGSGVTYWQGSVEAWTASHARAAVHASHDVLQHTGRGGSVVHCSASNAFDADARGVQTGVRAIHDPTNQSPLTKSPLTRVQTQKAVLTTRRE
jgi:hypothetical protein